MTLSQLDLFAGIGGFSLAASWFGIETTQFVEIDPYCQRVLSKNFPGVPIHADVTTFTAPPGAFDIITAGFPCQDLSSANPNGRGLDGERSGLFFEVVRLLRAVRPRFLLLENVPNLINRGLDRVLWEIAQSGFDAEWQVVSAASMGAPHRRERVFIIAYRDRIVWESGRQNQPGKQPRHRESFPCCLDQWTAPNAQGAGTGADDSGLWARAEGINGGTQPNRSICTSAGGSFWEQNPSPEPTICRVDAGLPGGLVARQLKALGNTVVPQCVAVVYQRLFEILEGADGSTP